MSGSVHLSGMAIFNVILARFRNHSDRMIHARCLFGDRLSGDACGRWPMLSPEAVSGRYARPV
eukprot:25088-Prymnesium_polylepis.1